MRQHFFGYLFVALTFIGLDSMSHSAATPQEASGTVIAADNDQSTETGDAPPDGTSAPSKDKSTLSGRVSLVGTPPTARQIQISKDPEVCSAAGKDVQDVVVGKNGGIADVVIEIQGIKAADDKEWNWKTPKDGYVLRQKDCTFEPKLLVIPSGAEVKVFNDDPVAHNVNTGQWNEMQPSGVTPVVKPLSGRSPIKVGCNIHSWMEAWVYPVSSPFFAVTNERGEFRIENIPPGKYRVAAWHSHLGKQRERITFEAGATVIQDFSFETE